VGYNKLSLELPNRTNSISKSAHLHASMNCGDSGSH